MLKTLWNKTKNIFSIIGAAAVAIIGILGAVLIGRRSGSNKPDYSGLEDGLNDLESGINDSIDRTRRIESGNSEAIGIAESLGDRNNSSKDRLDDIKESNNTVIDGLGRAQEILSGSKHK